LWTLKTLADGSQEKYTEADLLEHLRKSFVVAVLDPRFCGAGFSLCEHLNLAPIKERAQTEVCAT